MYQMEPPQPVQQPERPEDRRLSVPQIMLIVLVLGFAAWYLITTLTPEASAYGTISAGTLGSRYTGDCLIIRDETPFPRVKEPPDPNLNLNTDFHGLKGFARIFLKK